MNKAKFKIWIDEHWMNWALGIILIGTVIGCAIGTYVFLFQLDSFQKQTLTASIPLYLFNSLIAALSFVFCYWLFLYGGLTRMKAQKMQAEFVNVKFSDVVGLEEAKREAQEVVSLILDRARIKKI